MTKSWSTILRRASSQALNSIQRNRWANTMTITALTLVFLLVHLTSILIYSSEDVIQNLQSKIDVGVFFNAEASEYEIETFLTKLEGQKQVGEIQEYRYFSREDGLAEFEAKYPGRMVFLRRNKIDNPLLAMVEIVPHKKKADDLMLFLNREEFTTIIDQEFLRKNESERRRVSNFLAMANFAESSGLVVLLIFLLIATGLLFHAVGTAIKAHKKEIAILRLVGAKFWNIRLPFIVEGVLLTFISFILSLILVFVFLFFFSMSLKSVFLDPDLQADLSAFSARVISALPWNMLKNAGLILILAIVSSFLGIERNLRHHKIL